MVLNSTIQPAAMLARVTANSIDTIIPVSILYFISTLQKDSPPPTGMSFYTAQQFENYFMLVVAALLLVCLNGLMMLVGKKRTVGQHILGLSLVTLDGGPATRNQIIRRVLKTLGAVLFICIPGPIIALVIAIIVGALFSVPFSTADQMIIDAGISDTVRYILHGTSYVALLAATWFVFAMPLIRVLVGLKDGLTGRDRATHSTYIFSKSE